MCRMMGLTILAFALIARPAAGQDKVSPEELKAAEELKKGAIGVTVDQKHPDKPVIGLGYYARTLDERTIALLNQMKHLKSLGGYDVKFKPGTLKQLKGHPALDTLAFSGSTDLDAIKDLPEGPAIKHLFLGDGAFTAEHFEAIAKVPSLQSIRTSLARIKPELIRPLQKLKHLESLSIITDAPLSADDIKGFTGLTELACAAPADSPAFFEALAKMKSLRTLALFPAFGQSAPPKPPAGLEEIAALADLTELTLRVPVSDATLAAFARLKSLATLSAPSDGVTAAGMKALAKLPKLTSLRLAGKELPPDAAAELKGLTALKELYLSVGPLPEAGMKALGALDRLEVLQLGRFKPGADKVIPHVAKLTKLRTLDLTFSDLTDAGLAELAKLKDLTELKVGGTATTPKGRAALQKALPKLKVVTSFTTGPY
jgi:hypothetical protein